MQHTPLAVMGYNASLTRGGYFYNQQIRPQLSFFVPSLCTFIQTLVSSVKKKISSWCDIWSFHKDFPSWLLKLCINIWLFSFTSTEKRDNTWNCLCLCEQWNVSQQEVVATDNYELWKDKCRFHVQALYQLLTIILYLYIATGKDYFRKQSKFLECKFNHFPLITRNAECNNCSFQNWNWNQKLFRIKYLLYVFKAASSIKWNISFYKAQKKMWLILHFTHITHHIFPYFAAEYFWMCPPWQWWEECEVPLLNEGFSIMNSPPPKKVF